MKINPDELAKAVTDIMSEFVGATEDNIAGAVLRVSERTASELRSVTPPNDAPVYRSWSAYLADWDTTKLSVNKKGLYSVAVHNKRHYQLAHLLENGHALRQGGSTRAFTHIAPIAEKSEEQLMAEIKKGIK
jgi:hypothetical protein